MDETVVVDAVEDADMEAVTIMHAFDASNVVQSGLLLAEGHATDVVKAIPQGQGRPGEDSVQSSRTPREPSHADPCMHERMATSVLRSCREDLCRAVPHTAIW